MYKHVAGLMCLLKKVPRGLLQAAAPAKRESSYIDITCKLLTCTTVLFYKLAGDLVGLLQLKGLGKACLGHLTP